MPEKQSPATKKRRARKDPPGGHDPEQGPSAIKKHSTLDNTVNWKLPHGMRLLEGLGGFSRSRESYLSPRDVVDEMMRGTRLPAHRGEPTQGWRVQASKAYQAAVRDAIENFFNLRNLSPSEAATQAKATFDRMQLEARGQKWNPGGLLRPILSDQELKYRDAAYDAHAQHALIDADCDTVWAGPFRPLLLASTNRWQP